MPRGEIHVQLWVDFADDPKVRALARYGREGRLARDLFVQMMCYCKRAKSNGDIPDEQVGLLVYPDPARVGHRDAGLLVDVGLLVRKDFGYHMPSFLKRNKSRQQLTQEAMLAHDEGVRGNHLRWHEERNVTVPDCPYCLGPVSPPPDGVTDRVPDRGGESSESESESESYPTRSASDRVDVLDERFADFWAVYPKRKSKGQALKAWRTALRRKVDPDHIIAAAKTYADNVANIDQQFVKHPATWLNGECYDDEQTQTPQQQHNLSNADAWWVENG